jgi:hypothetical protein
MKTLLSFVAAVTLGAVIPRQTQAATVITNGTDAELRAAMTNCGTVLFNFDGVIVLTNAIPVSCAVTLDAMGHAVTLSGGNSNRIFQVLSNGNLTLINLGLANGRSTNGGAMYNEGTVTAQNCRFINNAAFGASGTNGTNGLSGTNDSNIELVTPGTPGGPGSNGQGNVRRCGL